MARKPHTFVVTEGQVRQLKERLSRGKTYIISESMVEALKDEANMTEYKFVSNIKKFLHDLLVDPINAEVPTALILNNFDKPKLLKRLLSNGIIRRDEKIHDTNGDGEPVTATMMIKYVVPKKNFERNLKKLYIKLFEENLPHQVNEDGEAMGATSCDSSGQFSAPVFPMQRREIKEEELDETTTCSGMSAMAYDAPAFGDKESLKRHNGVGGSVSVNIAK